MCQTPNKMSNFRVKKIHFGLYNLKCLSTDTKPCFFDRETCIW